MSESAHQQQRACPLAQHCASTQPRHASAHRRCCHCHHCHQQHRHVADAVGSGACISLSSTRRCAITAALRRVSIEPAHSALPYSRTLRSSNVSQMIYTHTNISHRVSIHHDRGQSDELHRVWRRVAHARSASQQQRVDSTRPTTAVIAVIDALPTLTSASSSG
jgi:hypothetical protein